MTGLVGHWSHKEQEIRRVKVKLRREPVATMVREMRKMADRRKKGVVAIKQCGRSQGRKKFNKTKVTFVSEVYVV